MNAINPSSSKPSTLAEAARQFVPVVKPGEILDKHKDAILLLRARGASYPSIAQMLQSYGVTIGDGTVSRFCRQHEVEIKRIRAKDEHADQDVQTRHRSDSAVMETPGLDQMQEHQDTSKHAQQHTTPGSVPTKMRSLRGKV